MKFGKMIRNELSPNLLRGSIDYKALKKVANKIRRPGGLTLFEHQRHHNSPNYQQQANQGAEEFFARVDLEKEKVAEFYRSREAWCFLALEKTRGALFGLTRRASKESLFASASAADGRSEGLVLSGSGGVRDSAGELEGKFLEVKANATVLQSEAQDLLKFVDMNMHGFRKMLKKFDKWTGGSRGREYFTSLVQTQHWINGSRAHGVLRMASAMSDHLRSLRPALSLGPAAGGASWADRIVYSIGTFDRPRFSQGPNATAAAKAASLFTAAEANSTGSKNNSSSVSAAGSGGGGDSGGNKGGGSGSNNGGGWVDGLVTSPSSGHQLTGLPATSDDGQESASERMSSPLRFLREFGAVVVVGVFTSAAHAALHTAGNGGEKGAPPTDSLEARCARVHAHADRIVVIDSPHPARVRELLLGAAAGAAADVAAAACASGPNAVVSEGVEPHSSLLPGDTFDSRGHQQHHHHQQALEIGFGATTPPPPPSKNCCFVVCDWRRSGSRAVGDAGAEAGRRARRDIRAVMEANMPLFRLPRTTWECTSASSSDGEEEGEGSVLAF